MALERLRDTAVQLPAIRDPLRFANAATRIMSWRPPSGVLSGEATTRIEAITRRIDDIVRRQPMIDTSRAQHNLRELVSIRGEEYEDVRAKARELYFTINDEIGFDTLVDRDRIFEGVLALRDALHVSGLADQEGLLISTEDIIQKLEIVTDEQEPPADVVDPGDRPSTGFSVGTEVSAQPGEKRPPSGSGPRQRKFECLIPPTPTPDQIDAKGEMFKTANRKADSVRRNRHKWSEVKDKAEALLVGYPANSITDNAADLKQLCDVIPEIATTLETFRHHHHELGYGAAGLALADPDGFTLDMAASKDHADARAQASKVQRQEEEKVIDEAGNLLGRVRSRLILICHGMFGEKLKTFRQQREQAEKLLAMAKSHLKILQDDPDVVGKKRKESEQMRTAADQMRTLANSRADQFKASNRFGLAMEMFPQDSLKDSMTEDKAQDVQVGLEEHLHGFLEELLENLAGVLHPSLFFADDVRAALGIAQDIHGELDEARGFLDAKEGDFPTEQEELQALHTEIDKFTGRVNVRRGEVAGNRALATAIHHGSAYTGHETTDVDTVLESFDKIRDRLKKLSRRVLRTFKQLQDEGGEPDESSSSPDDDEPPWKREQREKRREAERKAAEERAKKAEKEAEEKEAREIAEMRANIEANEARSAKEAEEFLAARNKFATEIQKAEKIVRQSHGGLPEATQKQSFEEQVASLRIQVAATKERKEKIERSDAWAYRIDTLYRNRIFGFEEDEDSDAVIFRQTSAEDDNIELAESLRADLEGVIRAILAGWETSKHQAGELLEGHSDDQAALGKDDVAATTDKEQLKQIRHRAEAARARNEGRRRQVQNDAQLAAALQYGDDYTGQTDPDKQHMEPHYNTIKALTADIIKKVDDRLGGKVSQTPLKHKPSTSSFDQPTRASSLKKRDSVQNLQEQQGTPTRSGAALQKKGSVVGLRDAAVAKANALSRVKKESNLADAQSYLDWADGLSTEGGSILLTASDKFYNQVLNSFHLPSHWGSTQREDFERQLKKMFTKQKHQAEVIIAIDIAAFGNKKSATRFTPNNCMFPTIRKDKSTMRSSSDQRKDCPMHGQKKQDGSDLVDELCIHARFADGVQSRITMEGQPEDVFDGQRQVDAQGKRWIVEERKPEWKPEDDEDEEEL